MTGSNTGGALTMAGSNTGIEGAKTGGGAIGGSKTGGALTIAGSNTGIGGANTGGGATGGSKTGGRAGCKNMCQSHIING